jgi:hypothetical protein
MQILFDATKPVKTTTTRRFAAGLLAFVPMSFVQHTASDEAEYAAMASDMDQARRDFDQHLEERYARSIADDVVSGGRPWL